MEDEEEIVFAQSPSISRQLHPDCPSLTLPEISIEEEPGRVRMCPEKALQLKLKKQARGNGMTRVSAKWRARNLYGLDTTEKDIKTDFTNFGFEQKRLNEMLRNTDVSDAYVGLIKGKNPPIALAEESGESTGQRPSRGKGKAAAVAQYENLWVTEGTNWVLFDPLRGYPVGIRRPPLIFKQFETFRPGNARIIEYNTESGCFRVRTTPRTFEGREVIYTRKGPRLVNLERMREMKHGRYQGRKHGVLEQEPQLYASNIAKEKQNDGQGYGENSEDQHDN